MSTYRVTWFFEGFQKSVGRGQSMFYGWTENWYLTINGNLDAALRIGASTAPKSWITLRKAFLHKIYAITAVRAVDTANPRKSKTVLLRAEGSAGIVTNLNKG